ncbi:gephyrin-like molybdotransferase Glp [Leekyejoonella antrihumi]|nr:gephyrin-like molybdotransferase Glp [Leekyejoonella antrihumi]
MTLRRADAITSVSLDDHVAAALSLVQQTEVCSVPLAEATGLVLADDLTAPGFLPAFDNAAMDGYAVHHADLAGTGGVPVHLPLADEIAACSTLPPPLRRGTAAPIMTGAPLPQGATAVVPIEHTLDTTAGVELPVVVPAGQHVRRRGQEHLPGDVLLGRGRLLRPVDLAVLAAAGISTAPVHRRPRVAVLGTGTELVAPGERRVDGAVHDANTTLLATLVRTYGADVTTLPPTADDRPDVLRHLVERAAATHDLVVTAGGVSAGTHEVVRLALDRRGSHFHPVAISPGAPQGLGTVAGTPLLALPGNPSAALVSCAMFVRPVVLALAGRGAAESGWTSVTLAQSLDRRPDRTRILPVLLEERGGRTLALECGSAHRLESFAAGEAIVRLEPGDHPVRAGSRVPALRL